MELYVRPMRVLAKVRILGHFVKSVCIYHHLICDFPANHVVLVWICDQDCYVHNIGFFHVLMLCVKKVLVVVIFPEIKLLGVLKAIKMLGVSQPADFYHISLNLLIYPGYVCAIVMYIKS